MEFNQFVDEVKGRIKQFLPIEYEDAQVRIEERIISGLRS